MKTNALSGRFLRSMILILLLGITALLVTQSRQLATVRAQQSPTRRVNVPYTNLTENIPSTENAIFWFGDIGPVNGTNPGYADGRAIFNDQWVQIVVHIFDRYVYYDETPEIDAFHQWDAVTLYLSRDGNVGNTPDAADYRFEAQVNGLGEPRDAYQATFRGNGGGWTVVPDFDLFTNSAHIGGGANNNADNRGWWVLFRIPFGELGLNGRPAPGTTWGMALTLHDRDTANNNPDIPDQHWPENAVGEEPSTWGQLRFGLPASTMAPTVPSGSTLIRQGHNGASVPDGQVGGNANCGVPPLPNVGAIWQAWGDLVYYSQPGQPDYEQIHSFMTYFNVQNQWDVADWPCFSKYYVTFPLDGLPSGQQITAATLTLHMFGHANDKGEWPGEPQPSYIQVLTVDEAWQLETLNWNDAPLARENVARTWVKPMPANNPPPHVAHQWDLTRAVSEAYAAGEPLRLVLYEADSERHSGKYFRASDFEDETKRPSLLVEWGEPFVPSHWSYLPLAVRR